ncbi:hypothetical protein OG205_28430 [Lentzea sp. NBC_00516]|uniref:hypothetical protein n=1 Tax=Lentzea sp. NBC_00516 TaxID=2903582 RepID=UPI002E81F512|nr:hypothetical protein [Lentzea sp. NBC_00516]WUD22025.1 hypothetical protein OG205_28430 [Lentzea sp. NBC_00516]
MGSRANYVIVDERGWELYFDNGGAVPLLGTFADGPAEVIEFVRETNPAEHWLDDVWCEGAALIDSVDHVLLLFTWHHDGVDDRARRLAAIRSAWPGWRIRWAYGGLEDVVAYLGIDRATVRAAERRHPVLQLQPGDFPIIPNCLVTIRQADGSVHGHMLDHLHGEPLWAGPGLLDSVAVLTPTQGWERQPDEDLGPELGLHFDLANREFGFWTAATFNGTVDEIAARWPGWRVEFWEDRHEEQTLRCGTGFRMFPFEAVSST